MREVGFLSEKRGKMTKDCSGPGKRLGKSNDIKLAKKLSEKFSLLAGP